MAWNKVDTSRTWKKVDVAPQEKVCSKEPLATLCGCKGRLSKIYLNDAAIRLAKDLGFEHATLDAYRSGAEWAFAKGERFVISMRKGVAADVGYVSGGALCDLIWTSTKCKRFRVSKQGEYLVLTPAYDLEKEGLAR